MTTAGNGAEYRDDEERGCGWRKEGGIYLVAPALSKPCGRLPAHLEKCKFCGAGFKPARGWTWVTSGAIPWPPCEIDTCKELGCPLACPADIGRAGLIWIGVRHYKEASDFVDEAARLGVSRRLNYLPRDFKLGETWIILAHRKVYPVFDKEGSPKEEKEWKPGIFTVFKPTAIEKVVTEETPAEEIEQIKKRGLTPVIVRRKENG